MKTPVAYFGLCEGPLRDNDNEYHAMLQACRQPGGLPLLLVKDLPPLRRASAEPGGH
jgi:hypothetical protein